MELARRRIKAPADGRPVNLYPLGDIHLGAAACDIEDFRKTVKTAGLNGHSELLKAFLDREAKRIDSRKAYEKVGGDIKRRFGFLAVPRNWLKALFYAAVAGLGFKIVSALPPIHLP